MRKRIWSIALICCAMLIGIWYWQKQIAQAETVLLTEYSYTNLLENVRLGDGMLLGIETFVRWRVDDEDLFYGQFENMVDYSNEVLYPRQSELSNQILFQYDKRAFRKTTIQKKIKQELSEQMCQFLKEKGIAILEVEIIDMYKQKTLAEIVAQVNIQNFEPIISNKKVISHSTSSQKRIDKLVQMQASTIKMLQEVETILQEKLIINSGFRDVEHNRKVKGVSNSAHLRGYAVDIAIYSKTHRKKLVKALEQVGFKRIGVYSNHVHADNDPSLNDARW